LASQFSFFADPADSAAYLCRLNQPDVRLLQRELVNFVNLGKLAAFVVQLV
jgi:hypothetical protein